MHTLNIGIQRCKKEWKRILIKEECLFNITQYILKHYWRYGVTFGNHKMISSKEK